MKINKIFFSITIITSLSWSVDLDSMINSNIDNTWGKFSNMTKGINEICYEPDDLSIFGLDICQQLNKLNKLNAKICSSTPNFMGFKKKNSAIGLSGLKKFCQARVKEFTDISATVAGNVVENIWDEINEKLGDKILPNGKKYSEYIKIWDINNILKVNNLNTDTIRNYILNSKNEELKVVMDYLKSSNGTGKDTKNFNIKDIKAPENLESYKIGVFELANIFSTNSKETSPSTIGNVLAKKIENAKLADKQSIAKNYLQNVKVQISNAKANEIGQRLELARSSDDIIIPTQEYVNILRDDLKMSTIAKIRKQQLREAQIVSQVNEKWNKREILNQLIAEKELIMAMKFNEVEAQLKIDKIINSVH